MALFGLSPLFLSLIATRFFTSEDSGLDITRFVSFMAILAGIVHVIGALNLRTPPITPIGQIEVEETQEDEEATAGQSADERTPLIVSKARPNVEISVIPVEQDQTVFDLLKDPYFWLLALTTLVCLGSVSLSTSYDYHH